MANPDKDGEDLGEKLEQLSRRLQEMEEARRRQELDMARLQAELVEAKQRLAVTSNPSVGTTELEFVPCEPSVSRPEELIISDVYPANLSVVKSEPIVDELDTTEANTEEDSDKFATLSSLLQVHKNTPLVCTICNKKFRKKKTYNNHINSHHNSVSTLKEKLKSNTATKHLSSSAHKTLTRQKKQKTPLVNKFNRPTPNKCSDRNTVFNKKRRIEILQQRKGDSSLTVNQKERNKYPTNDKVVKIILPRVDKVLPVNKYTVVNNSSKPTKKKSSKSLKNTALHNSQSNQTSISNPSNKNSSNCLETVNKLNCIEYGEKKHKNKVVETSSAGCKTDSRNSPETEKHLFMEYNTDTFKYNCPFCSECFKSISKLNTHKISHLSFDKNDSEVPILPGVQTPSNNDFLTEMQEVMVYVCCTCNKYFKTLVKYNKHLDKHSIAAAKEKCVSQSEVGRNTIHCFACNMSFLDEQSYNQHQCSRYHQFKIFLPVVGECSSAADVLPSDDSLTEKSPFSKDCSSIANLNLVTGPRTSLEVDNYSSHKNTVHSTSPSELVCKVCDMRFCDKRRLKNHVIMHFGL